MNIHIQCLSLSIILFTLNPLSIAQLIEFINGNTQNIKIDRFFRNLCGTYIISIIISYYLIPESISFNMPKSSIWFWIAIIGAPIVILVEILVAYILLKIRGEKLSQVKIASRWVDCNINTAIYTILIGVLEEVVYRQIWFYLMLHILQFDIVTTVVASSLFYSLNHFVLGKDVLIQKFISGVIFSLLFYLSGEAIIVSILCHGLQNIIVVIRGKMNG